MQYTSNYNLKKPEGTDIVNIDDLNNNADILDQKLKEVENKADNAPPNSVNDAAIGSRTPDQSQAPASPGTGTLTQLISWLANRIKAITGKTNWWDAPPTTLQAAKTHMDAAAPHSGHETPAGAQAKAEAAEAAAKQYTDDRISQLQLTADNITLDSPYFTADNVQDGMNELFTSVSNGKNAIASAITDMGQNASGGDSFSTLANKIKDISKDATAGVGDVLSGKTFYQGGLKRTGNMPNRGAVVITPSTTNQTITAGYHNGNGYVKGDPDLKASNIKKDVEIFGVVGTLTPSPVLEPGNQLLCGSMEGKANYSYSSRGWIKVIDVQIFLGGGVRVSYSIDDGNLVPEFVLSRIYKNGQPFGILRRTAHADLPTTFTEDISINPGDAIQVYVSIERENTSASLTTVRVYNFKITTGQQVYKINS